MFQEPILLVGSFFILLVSIMFYARLNFKIGGSSKSRPVNADKIGDVLNKIKDLHEQRVEHHHSIDSSLQKVWKLKSETVYNQEKKKSEAALANIKKEVQKAISDLEALDNEIARKVKDIERREEKKSLAQDKVHQNEINYRLYKNGTKEVFEEQKSQLENAYTIAEDEVEGLVSDLTDSL